MLKRIIGAGLLSAAVTGSLLVASPAALAAGNTNANLAPWQICGSNTPIVGGLGAVGSPASAHRCTNAYVPGSKAGDTNVNVLPWQICGSNTPIVAVGIPVGSPASAGDCTNASVN